MGILMHKIQRLEYQITPYFSLEKVIVLQNMHKMLQY